MSHLPLVTFAVRTFNCERFVREALESAFAQTYHPLEIVISDDTSSDATFELASEIVAGYEGPHEVVLHRNPTNLGPGGNIDRIGELSHGELIVFADADDLSVPERAARTVERWTAAGCPSASLMSRFSVAVEAAGARAEDLRVPQCPALTMNIPDGRLARLETFVRGMAPAAFGCAQACTRDLVEDFSPLRDLRSPEDTALSFRALLAGEFLVIDEDLVTYRLHDANVSATLQPSRPSVEDLRVLDIDQARHSAIRARLYKTMQNDLDTALERGLVPPEWHRRLSPEIARIGKMYRILSCYLASPWLKRVLHFVELARLRAGTPRLKLAALHLAPYEFGLRARHARLERRTAAAERQPPNA